MFIKISDFFSTTQDTGFGIYQQLFSLNFINSPCIGFNINFTFIRKVTWLIKFETRKCSEVKDLTLFLSAVVFAKTYFTFLPSRATNRQIC
jgi:hypothetical protein